MIRLKSPADIAALAEGGAIMGRILDEITEKAVAGVTGQALDELARQRIAEADNVPSFLNYAPRGQRPFPAALCVSINEDVVHGLPNTKPFKAGDVIGLDLGMIYKGKYYLDSARTVGIEPVSPEAKKLLNVTRQALTLGIKAAQVGNHIGDISWAVQRYVENQGFAVVRQLVGHGVGFAVHEEPAVPNFGKPGAGVELKPGLVIAIEPMVTIGDPTIETAKDGWSITTKTGNLSAHEEHTVAITENGPRILTQSQ